MLDILSEIKKGATFNWLHSLVATLILCFMLGAPLSQAKTLSVPESSPTIKGALIKAKAGDIVLVSCGTYYEHSIRMKPGVALWSGTLQPGCVTIDAQGKGRHFIMDNADSITAVVGFTLLGGQVDDTEQNQGGSIICRNSSPRISNCVFKDNTAKSGGAIFADQTSDPLFANCLFENNKALTTGGAAQCQGKAVFRQCAFENNLGLMGGGLALMPGSNVLIRGCTLENNASGNTGGGLHVRKARCEISHSIFAGNWGGLGGSALSIVDSELILNHCTLYKNMAESVGAAMAIQGQSPQVRNCIIAFNQGSVLRADSEVPTFRGCNLFGNEGGDWVENLRSLGNKYDNISKDPMFCAPDFGNFNLNNSSPCLPGNNPSGNKGLIGACVPGCASADNIPRQEQNVGSGFRAVQAGL